MKPVRFSRTGSLAASPLSAVFLTLLFLLPLSILIAHAAKARAACTDSAPVCVDGPGSKFVNGVEVWRDCWNYQTERTCSEPQSADYCSGIAKTPGCKEESAICTAFDWNGSCLKTQKVFACSDSLDEASADNLIFLNHSHTVQSGSDTSACQSFLDNPDCYIAREECTEGPETRIINGVAIFKDCWKKTLQYSCAAAGVSNSCQQLAISGCRPTGDPVCEREGASGCAQYRQTYQCSDLPTIEGDDIVASEPDTRPGFNLLACNEATASLSCRAPLFSCLQTDDAGECVLREYTYDCLKTVDENRCEALEKQPECTVNRSVCAERDGLKCIAYKKEIFCRTDSPLAPEGVTVLDQSIVIGAIEPSTTCLPLAENPACAVLKTECAEGPAEKEVNGDWIYKDCWQYETTYVCAASGTGPGSGGGGSGDSNGSLPGAGGSQSDCSALEGNPECVKVASECIAADDAGACLTRAHTYRCTEKEGSVTAETVCRPAECLDGLCEGSTDPADDDFSRALAYLEIVRQASVYGDIDNERFFQGEADRCSKKVLGFSCCDTKVKAGTSNASAFGKSLQFAGDATVEAIKYIGSPYVYDVLSASEATSSMLTFLYGNAASGVYNPSLSFYGFGMSLQGGTMYFTFDPTSFALSVAFQIAMDYLQCEPSEQALMLKKGQNLCRYVGTYCSKGEAFGCVERSESYCCYNSPLARILQEQGRLQLGKGWGSAKNPDCSGFTLEELERLDFDAMDLSEFEALIVRKNALNDEAARDRGEAHVQTLTEQNLGGYIPPKAGASSVDNPNFTGSPKLTRPSPPNG